MDRNNQQDREIVVLQTNYHNMAEKIDKLERVLLRGIEELKMEIKCWREEADKRYASKLTEKIVYAMASLILVSFFWWLITLVLK
jgi:hypothetical protein